MAKFLLAFFTLYHFQSIAQISFEVGPSFVSYKSTFGSSHIATNPQIVRFLAGYEFSQEWSGEFITGVGQLSNSSVYLDGTKVPNIEVKFEKAYGVYLKRHQFICDGIKLFGRIGYASIGGQSSYQSFTERFKESGVSYGVGTALKLKNNEYLIFDY